MPGQNQGLTRSQRRNRRRRRGGRRRGGRRRRQQDGGQDEQPSIPTPPPANDWVKMAWFLDWMNERPNLSGLTPIWLDNDTVEMRIGQEPAIVLKVADRAVVPCPPDCWRRMILHMSPDTAERAYMIYAVRSMDMGYAFDFRLSARVTYQVLGEWIKLSNKNQDFQLQDYVQIPDEHCLANSGEIFAGRTTAGLRCLVGACPIFSPRVPEVSRLVGPGATFFYYAGVAIIFAHLDQPRKGLVLPDDVFVLRPASPQPQIPETEPTDSQDVDQGGANEAPIPNPQGAVVRQARRTAPELDEEEEAEIDYENEEELAQAQRERAQAGAVDQHERLWLDAMEIE